MNISIRYSGTLNDINTISDFNEEMTDISRSMGWATSTLNDPWDNEPDGHLVETEEGIEIEGSLGLKGIAIYPSTCAQPFDFFFDKNGKMYSIINRALELEGASEIDFSLSVDTTESNPEFHIWFISLLKYLKKKYISNLDVIDEGTCVDLKAKKTYPQAMRGATS